MTMYMAIFSVFKMQNLNAILSGENEFECFDLT